ncbi:MAG: hypothetical protein HOE90_00680, partial [Bacteriovoracaceae bacterium]|nr:hypothetical protein [Bacteriovoracaceae bacterium]
PPPPHSLFINLLCDESINKEFKSSCSVDTHIGDTKENFSNVLIKLKGKKSEPQIGYGLYFEDKVNLFDIESSKTWRLTPLFRDLSFLREKLSNDLFQLLNPKLKIPKLNFIEVFINGNYNGLYLLHRKLTRKALGIKKKSQWNKKGIIFKAKSGNRDELLSSADKDLLMSQFQQVYPDLYRYHFDRMDYLLSVREGVKALSENDPEKILSLFNLDNYFSYYLFSLLSGNKFNASFYLFYVPRESISYIIQNNNSKSFGISHHREMHYINDIDAHPLYLNIDKNPLYWKMLQVKWKEIEEDQQILDFLNKKVDHYTKLISDSADRDFAHWQKPRISDATRTIHTNWKREIEYLKTWIERRTVFLNSYFSENEPRHISK